MATETAKINALTTLTAEQIAKMQVYGEYRREALPTNQKIMLSAETLAEVPEETVVFFNKDLNQEVTLKGVLSMFHETTSDMLVDFGTDMKLIPFGKGVRIKDILAESGKVPESITILEGKVYEGATKAYLEDSVNGEARKAAYAHFAYDTTGDNFPLLKIRNRRKPATDGDNWKTSPRSLVKID